MEDAVKDPAKTATDKTVTAEDVALIGTMSKVFMKYLEMAETNIQGVNTDAARLAVLSLMTKLNRKDPEAK